MGGEVKSMRALLVAIGALVIVAACGRVPGGQVSPGDYKLYVAASTSTSQQLSVIDSRSHSVELNMPLGTPSPDWTHLYTVKGDTLLDLDPQTGATRRSLQLPGSMQLPPATLSGVPGGLSPNGRWLVLESFDRTDSIPAATHMLVVDTTYVSAPRQIDLKGLFNFDAVSNDGQRVYMIQYLTGNQYHVRFYDLSIGRLDPQIVFDKSDGSAAMAGLRLSGVASPDGHWLYSMYIRENQGPFIHALSLDDPIAICIDLPGDLGYSTNPDEFRWSLTMNAAGTHLYAANGATGIVADLSIDGGVPNHQRTVQLVGGQTANSFIQNVEAKELGGNAAALSPDGQTLVIAGKTGLVWVDTASLKARDRQLTGWNIWSVAMAPDGATVYAMDDTGMIAELPVKGARAATTFGGAGGQPLALIRVAAA
ncbi:MAG: hypothetical protein AUI42_12670 [Actinobacteria bacterium 13_1_40CM_2_65_8]|nr:MAG: hypothetical protein AUI42_12670 [Actinobacteria bacterium 13_1_40CM_2_65_8]